MSFDWQSFLDQYNVDYVTVGPNVARGDVNVRCPFCAAGDPSHHMGVSLNGRGWSCWRDRRHRGKSAARLVQMLLGCSSERAQAIVGSSANVPGYLAVGFDAEEQQEAPRRKLKLLPEFRPFVESYSAKPFFNYLSDKRHFTRRQILHLTDEYDLQYCTRGAFKGRIIFPIYYQKRLVNWTARSIYPSVTLRYKTLSTDEEESQNNGLPAAVSSIGKHLLWYDDLLEADADTIILVEGPFDALKVNVLGRPHGVVATCFFTSSPSDNQLDLFHELLPRFRRRIVLPDVGAEVMGMSTAALLAPLSVVMKTMPKGADDPGELTEDLLLNKVLAKRIP